MSLGTRQALNEILHEHGAPQDDDIPSFSILNPDYVAEEGNDQWVDLSHEGGEYRDLEMAFEDTVSTVQYVHYRF